MSDIRFYFLEPTIEELSGKTPGEIQAILKEAAPCRNITVPVLDARFNAGIILYYGINVPQNIKESLKMFEKSSQLGTAEKKTKIVDRGDLLFNSSSNKSLSSREGRINLSKMFHVLISYLHPELKFITAQDAAKKLGVISRQYAYPYMIWLFIYELLSCNKSYLYIEFSSNYLSYFDIETVPWYFSEHNFTYPKNFRSVSINKANQLAGVTAHPAREKEIVYALHEVAKEDKLNNNFNYRKSHFCLGLLYQKGLYVKNDASKAFAHYKNASTNSGKKVWNFPEAYRALSLCHLTGVGTEKNEEKAVDSMVSYINSLFPPSSLSVIDYIDTFAPFTANARRGFAYYLLYCECSEHFSEYNGLLKNEPTALSIAKKSDVEWTHKLLFKAAELGYQPAKNIVEQNSGLTDAYQQRNRSAKVAKLLSVI